MSTAMPPKPKAVAHEDEAFGETRIDHLAWLEKREDPDVLAYLREENLYSDSFFSPRKAVTKALFDEIRSHINEDDLSVPFRDGDYWYYSRSRHGASYQTHLRCPATDLEPPHGLEPQAGEEIILDENIEAQGHGFFSLGLFELSPDQRILAYGVDLTGDEQYSLRFRDLDRGKDLDDVIDAVTYGLAWSKDSSSVHYLTLDEALRPHELWFHHLGSPREEDRLIYREDDRLFSLALGATRDGEAIILEAHANSSSEAWWIPSAAAQTPLASIMGREAGVEYIVRFHELIAHQVGRRLSEFVVTSEHLVTTFRYDAELRAQVQAFKGLYELEAEGFDVEAPMPGLVYVIPTPLAHGENLRVLTSSLTQPRAIFDLDLRTQVQSLRRQIEVPGGFEAEQYVSFRLDVVASDGALIPVSLVHHRDLLADKAASPPAKPAPLLLYGYGAYEISIDPSFSSMRLPLLDRGVIFAIAHVRGGGEKGRGWYDQGHLEHKENSFTDFVDVARALIAQGFTDADQLAIRGRSAGGLLMGAANNLAPELFAAVIAEVPFVDVLTTMRNESLPLTVGEWEEWGDPLHDEEAYRRLCAYSPVDNVSASNADGSARRYPKVLATGGLNDSRVAYWEPAKWINALRQVPGGPYFMRTELEAGHGGPSGRYDAWQEEAIVLTFLLDALGLPHPEKKTFISSVTHRPSD
ncbi:MAG: S9 family peptidase [Actinobacteria bacterium]|nr:S9 family peptidase [Actinomycetota bacterium]